MPARLWLSIRDDARAIRDGPIARTPVPGSRNREAEFASGPDRAMTRSGLSTDGHSENRCDITAECVLRGGQRIGENGAHVAPKLNSADTPESRLVGE